MACTITTGRGIGCRDAIGGLRALYIVHDTNAPLVLNATNSTVSAGELTAISGGVDAHKIDLTAEAGSYSSALQASVENGTIFYEQTIEFSLLKADIATSEFLHSLAKVRCTILAHDNNDNVYVVGFGNGAELTANTLETGMAYGDKHGFSATIVAKTTTPPYMLARTAGAGTAQYPLDGVSDGASGAGLTIGATLIDPAFS